MILHWLLILLWEGDGDVHSGLRLDPLHLQLRVLADNPASDANIETLYHPTEIKMPNSKSDLSSIIIIFKFSVKTLFVSTGIRPTSWSMARHATGPRPCTYCCERWDRPRRTTPADPPPSSRYHPDGQWFQFKTF